MACTTESKGKFARKGCEKAPRKTLQLGTDDSDAMAFAHLESKINILQENVQACPIAQHLFEQIGISATSNLTMNYSLNFSCGTDSHGYQSWDVGDTGHWGHGIISYQRLCGSTSRCPSCGAA